MQAASGQRPAAVAWATAVSAEQKEARRRTRSASAGATLVAAADPVELVVAEAAPRAGARH
jgi:hypothetical protein